MEEMIELCVLFFGAGFAGSFGFLIGNGVLIALKRIFKGEK